MRRRSFRGVPFSGGFDLILKAGIHRTRLGARDRLDLAGAGPRAIGFTDELVQALLENREPVDIRVAELDLHLGMAWNDRGSVWLEQYAADRPHGTQAGDFGKAVVNARRQPHHRNTGVFAPHHARRAGMVLLADQ